MISSFWHLHAHSKFSAGDALTPVDEMVKIASTLGQPALALTDHGNMAGAVQLYLNAKKRGIAPFPGEEFYLKRDASDDKRYHIGIVAFTSDGYEALTRLSSYSHTRARFSHKPHVDFSDFAALAESGLTQGLALTTGCYFGMVQQTLLQRGQRATKQLIRTLAGWFPHTYVELQHHNITHDGVTDDEIVQALYGIASDLGLPVVITQDAHYATVDDKPAHETLKKLVSWGPDSDDAVFPGDSFHLADERFVASHYDSMVWSDGLDGLKDLYSRHSLRIPELERYHYNVPVVTAGDPLDELRFRTELMIDQRGFHHSDYLDRWDEELEVVEATNMAGYLMLNAMICDWMREEGIVYEARGSASGSLLCYLLKITQVNPVKEGLRYERFLSKDRTKPPDIDLDIEDRRRPEVIQWLSDHFNVCQIGTWGEYSADAHTGRGSLFVAYLARLRKDGVDPEKLARIKGLNDIRPSDREKLLKLGNYKPFKAYGTHAGGLVITSSRNDFDRLVPTMLVASSETTVTQYEMDDVEALGLLKEDILGQKSLSTLHRCAELLGRDVRDGWDWIPLNDKETFRAIRQQKVDGVFQLEGWTCRNGCREMKPRSINDITRLVAIYRPATIDTGIKDLYIRRRAKWEAIPDRHPILMKAFKETHGLPVFQDQVIVVLREIGFQPEDLTALLKAVKASNENIGDAAKVIRGYARMFTELASQAGFTDEDTIFTWDAIEGFAKYGFNKAHATTYGRRAYRMAYLKTHHPLEFHTSLLQTWAGQKPERDYIIATRDAGIPLLGPDVNISGATWSLDRERGAIRRGLVSIKGIGDKAAEELSSKAPFKDMDDLIRRCDARPVTGGKNWTRDKSLNGVLGILKEAKALRSLGV